MEEFNLLFPSAMFLHLYCVVLRTTDCKEQTVKNKENGIKQLFNMFIHLNFTVFDYLCFWSIYRENCINYKEHLYPIYTPAIPPCFVIL